MSNFQTILITVFTFFVVIGVLIFSGVFGTPKSKNSNLITGNVVIWGTLEKITMDNIFYSIIAANKGLQINYLKKDEATIDQELIEALALDNGPDLIFLKNDSILKNKNKIYPIPFVSFPEKNFRDSFVQAGEVYLDETGILALPLTIDPMVMYYNRSIFDEAGISKAPNTWEEISDLALKLSVKDGANNIKKSAVALGTFDNINYAKDILTTLLFQSNNQIVEKGSRGTNSTLTSYDGGKKMITQSVLEFYSQFADPVKSVYSWNRGLVNSLDSFINEDLVIYFGYASDLFKINAKNPNLNFDVVAMPQFKETNRKVIYGKINAIALLKNSQNLNSAFAVANALVSDEINAQIASSLSLPPVKRSLLVQKPATPYYASVFYDSALIARSWLDPAGVETKLIFKDLVDGTLRGYNLIEIIIQANDRLNLLLEKYQ